MSHVVRKWSLASSIALALAGIDASSAAESNSQDTQHVANARHEMQILTSFGANVQLRAFDLTVRVDGNTAVLGGTVEDGVSKDLAERIANGAEGIQSVENRIIVDSSYAFSLRAAKR